MAFLREEVACARIASACFAVNAVMLACMAGLWWELGEVRDCKCEAAADSLRLARTALPPLFVATLACAAAMSTMDCRSRFVSSQDSSVLALVACVAFAVSAIGIFAVWRFAGDVSGALRKCVAMKEGCGEEARGSLLRMSCVKAVSACAGVGLVLVLAFSAYAS